MRRVIPSYLRRLPRKDDALPLDTHERAPLATGSRYARPHLRSVRPPELHAAPPPCLPSCASLHGNGSGNRPATWISYVFSRTRLDRRRNRRSNAHVRFPLLQTPVTPATPPTFETYVSPTDALS